MKFSLLISTYIKENPCFLYNALISIWDDQILKPSEIIIVKDGPLTEELNIIINDFSKKAPIKCIALDKNSGLGISLAKGLDACSNEIVARMDTDDIAHPDRFEKQIKFMLDHPEYDIIGSNIAEFNQTKDQIASYRKLPEHHEDILEFAKRRNPMNHMSIVFKKKAVLAAGNYLTFPGYEDYFLWIRMLKNNSKFYNIQSTLIYARIGNNLLARRKGIKFFDQELKLQKELYRIGFINYSIYITNLILRGIPRLFPQWGLKYIYKFLR